ncbi:hypothetical protein MAPG_09427 [Magnaporthiopsis poae ATCC 64411]|uniref:Adiponectin receptor protein 1 n=1 Tax=Magnaporthiopsis poae (strain ATCC 64411 / 73-15) TaxID=644358 RepID=A0A0C4E9X7_MAGP6|nr:hypothetical protein MAPG_09427 [Magnaporthiopsis poae ATCC 64411]
MADQVTARKQRRTTSSWPPSKKSKPDTHLLTNSQVPAWYSQPLIRTGYRPVTNSWAACLRTLVDAGLHNETVNIYSHLIPAAICAVLLLVGGGGLVQLLPPSSTPADRLVLAAYLCTSLLCFTASAAYHTFMCHSERGAALWVRVDYAAILLQILGSVASGLYFSFYCEPALQRLYWSMISFLVLVAGAVVVSPRLQHRKWRAARTWTFIATGMSAFAPIVHGATIFPYRQLDRQTGLSYYYVEGLLVLLGAWHFGSRFPECWKPGRFDIFGASHQIFHVLVAASAAVHLCGLLSALRWNHENARCSLLELGS